MARGLSRRRLLALLAFLAIVLLPALAFAGGDGDFKEYESRGWGWMYLASFGFGFLTSLTPCVYPMIPITLAIFGARGKDVSKRRAITLATVYVLGMGATYSALGVTFALLGGGAGFGSQLSSPYLVIPLVLLFCVLAASMFGAFELNLPAGIQAKLNQVGGKGYGGAFAMGLVGGLIAAPCTGPFLLGLLTFVSTTGSVVGGGSLLFVYAIGMGVLFWVLAAFAMSLPKSGPWMESVKSAGGVGLLVAALYFLRPLVKSLETYSSPELWFLLASIALAVVGIALGAIKLSFHGTRGEKLRKAIGVALLVGGAYSAWAWKLTPDRKLPWVYDEAAAFAKARAENKGVMVDFAADWCGPCKELEVTFGDPEVYQVIVDNFVTLKVDVSKGTKADEAMQEKYDSMSLPSVVFVDVNQVQLGKIAKEMGPSGVLEILQPAAKKLREKRASNP